MGRWLLLALVFLDVGSPGAQEAARPVDGTVVPAEATAANQAALTAAAAQTAHILQDRDANARALAAYDRAQADYARTMQAFEAEKAAAARRAADEAAAYRRRVAAWEGEKDKRAAARRPSSNTAAVEAPAKRHCSMELQIGSHIPVRICGAP